MEYTETDLLVRLVEPLYDTAWAYHMSSSTDNVVDRIEKRRKAFSSSASVMSMATSSSNNSQMVGLDINEKLVAFERMLGSAHRLMRTRQFEDVCRVSLKSNDDLYPGFSDILMIAQYILERSDPFVGKLTCSEISGISLTQVFQHVFYQLCSFMLKDRMGRQAMKLIVTPTKITHGAYDLCKLKFCRLLSDRTDLVQGGLDRLIRRIIRDRYDDDGEERVTTEGGGVKKAAGSDKKGDEDEEEAAVPKGNGENGSSAPETPSRAVAADACGTACSPDATEVNDVQEVNDVRWRRRTASVSSRISFPVIDLSSDEEEDDDDDDDDRSSVSSLDSNAA